MTDPRNVAHDKKVQQEKKHRGEDPAPDAANAPQPGRKPQQVHHAKYEKNADAANGDGNTPGDSASA